MMEKPGWPDQKTRPADVPDADLEEAIVSHYRAEMWSRERIDEITAIVKPLVEEREKLFGSMRCCRERRVELMDEALRRHVGKENDGDH
jgi:hypothetical protein